MTSLVSTDPRHPVTIKAMSSDRKIRIRIALAIVRDGKLLMVQHEKNDRRYWLLPGGGLEFGETITECGVRELQEEARLRVKVGDLIFASETIPPDEHRHVLNLYYEGQIVGDGEPVMGEDPVVCDVQWIDIADLPHLKVYPAVTHELLEAIEGRIPKRSLGNRWE